MPNSVPAVNVAVRECLEKSGVNINKAAEKISKSPKQFGRELRGQTKTGIVSPETVSALYEQGLIDHETKEVWFDSARQVYRLKATSRLPWWQRIRKGVKK